MKMVGNRGNPAEVGGFGEVFMGQKPLDVGNRSGGPNGGAFSLGLDNGASVMAAALGAASEIFQMRWSPPVPSAGPTPVMVLKALHLDVGAVVAFAAGRLLFRLWKAKAWSANGTGGTQVLPAAGTNKRRTSTHADSLFLGGGDIRIASTAALGAGTKTLEAASIGSIAVSAPTTVGPILTRAPLFRMEGDAWPVILEKDEGLVITADVAGTGTWYFGVTPEWVEKDDYK